MSPDEVYQEYKDKFASKIEDMSKEQLEIIFYAARDAEMPKIAVLPYLGEGETVSYSFSELTAICPMTALPDTYTLIIQYEPGNKVPELKSLRYYFLAYRNLPIIHELLLDKIRQDFRNAVEPKELKVTLDVAIRGGIKTDIEG